jgi:hypothetical protein
MRFARALMPTFTDDLFIVYDDTANRRIRVVYKPFFASRIACCIYSTLLIILAATFQ